MFVITAPYPAVQTALVLPSPQWGDSVRLAATMQQSHGMDGTLYTYVKAREGRRRFQWDFRLSRHKALELRAFIKAYHSSKLRITDHFDQTIIGHLTVNPFEHTGSGRAKGFPGGETMDITLEFEEVT